MAPFIFLSSLFQSLAISDSGPSLFVETTFGLELYLVSFAGAVSWNNTDISSGTSVRMACSTNFKALTQHKSSNFRRPNLENRGVVCALYFAFAIARIAFFCSVIIVAHIEHNSTL